MTLEEVRQIRLNAMLGSPPTARQALEMAEVILDCTDEVRGADREAGDVNGSYPIENLYVWIGG